MADINLLPTDMRQREERERRRGAHGHEREVQLTNPAAEKQSPRLQSLRLPWWRRLFGEPNRGRAPLLSHGQHSTTPPVASAAPRVTPPVSARPRPLRTHTSWWRAMLGLSSSAGAAPARPQSQVTAPSAPAPVSVAHTSAPRPESTFRISSPPPPSRPTAGHRPRHESSPTGWRAVLQSLFHPRPKTAPRGVHDQPAPRPSVAPSAPAATPASRPLPARASHHHTSATTPTHKSFDINLIPEELMARVRVSSRGQKLALATSVIVPLILLTLMSLILRQAERTIDAKIESNTQAIAALEAKLEPYRTEANAERHVVQKLRAIKSLWQSHVYWSPFFAGLEKYTLDDVRYERLTANVSRELVIPAVATDYGAAARQLAVLREASDFTVSSAMSELKLQTNARQGAVGVTFNLKLLLHPDLLKRP